MRLAPVFNGKNVEGHGIARDLRGTALIKAAHVVRAVD